VAFQSLCDFHALNSPLWPGKSRLQVSGRTRMILISILERPTSQHLPQTNDATPIHLCTTHPPVHGSFVDLIRGPSQVIVSTSPVIAFTSPSSSGSLPSDWRSTSSSLSPDVQYSVSGSERRGYTERQSPGILLAIINQKLTLSSASSLLAT
jgi:hypothetical protein